MATKQELTIVLTADGTGLTGTVRMAGGEVRKFGAEVDDMGKKADKASKSLDNSAKTAGMFGKAMGAAAAAAIVGFSALVAKQIDVADNTLKMSQRIGISVEALSSLGYAAKRNGADIEVLNAGLYGLAESAARAAGGAKLPAAAFRTLGIDVTDAVGKIKPMDGLLVEVARKLAAYPPGAAKAAMANQVFGESGKQLMLTLDELGNDGLQSLIDKATKAGQVIGTDTALAAAQFNDNLDALKGTVVALANEVMTQALPQINALAELMKGTETNTAGANREVSGFERVINVVAKAGLIVKNVIDGLGITIIGLGKSAWATGVLMTEMMTAPARATAAFATDGVDGVKAVIAGIGASAESMKQTWAEAWSAFKQGWSEAGTDILAGADKLDAAMNRTAQSTATVGAAAAQAAPPLMNYGKAAKEAGDDTDKLASSQAKMSAFLSRLRGESGPVSKAVEEFGRQIAEANRHAAAMVKNGHSLADVQQQYAEAVRLANTDLAEQMRLMREQADVVGTLQREMRDDASMAVLSERQRFVAEKVREAQRAYQDLAPQIRALHPLTEERLEDLAREAQALYDHNEAVEFWRNTWTQAVDQVSQLIGEFAVGNIRSFKDFGKSLWQIAKQTVSQIIAEFARLAIIRMFTGGGGGGGWGSMLAAAASGAGGGGGGGGGWMGMVSNGSSMGNTASSVWSNGQSAWNAYQNGGNVFGSLFGMGGTSLAGNVAAGGIDLSLAASGSYGSGVSLAGNQALGGINLGSSAGAAAPYGGTVGGYSTLGIGGALAGAAYGYGRGDGGWGTAASTAAGAFGGYAIGAGVAAGAGAVAGGATLTAGAAAGLDAIPVVGWIALAALAVDAISGGKLFGTRFTTKGSTTTTSISEDDSNVTAVLHQERQKALFGGIKRRDKDVDPGDEARAGANDLREALRDQMAADAAAVEADIIPIVSGIFETITKYTKKGKVKSEQTFSEVLGQRYEEDANAFAMRLGAENRIALADAIGAGGMASQLAEEYRASAETLSVVATYLLQAQYDINKGQSLLTTQAGDTLEDVTAVVREMAASGETLLDTYQRLQQASAQYRGFIAQFEEPETVASQYQAELRGVLLAMRENIATANALAKAAGLAGAREEDLAKIHAYAARQAEALANQLTAAAITQAQSLGYIDTWDSLNARIEELQARASESASAFEEVGQAVERTTDTMRQQMRLLLGDLSPFNDRRKLELAREGLQAGTVSQEEFLAIAQRLFGSTSRYMQEWEFAQRYPGVQDSGSQPSGRGDSAQPLTSEEQRELADLIARRDEIMARERDNAARVLAQQIADISSARGQTIEEVMAGLGVTLEQLGGDLGMGPEKLIEYIEGLRVSDLGGIFEKSLDGVSAAIYEIGSAIVGAIRGDEIEPRWERARAAGIDDADDAPASRFARASQDDPPPPVPAAPGDSGDGMLQKSGEAQAETNARLASMEERLAQLLQVIAENTLSTSAHMPELAGGMTDLAAETHGLRDDLRGSGRNSAPAGLRLR